MEYLPSKQNMLLGIPISLVALRYLLYNKKSNDIESRDHNKEKIIDLDNKIKELELSEFNSLVDSIKIPTSNLSIINNTQFLCKNDMNIFKNYIIDNLNFVNQALNELYKKKNIILDKEIKNLPKHISINGEFQELNYYKIYDNLELLKDFIIDSNDSIVLIFDSMQSLDEQNFNSLVDQWCNTKKIVTNLDINTLPTLEFKDNILNKLKIILENHITYTNKINQILDLFDYIITNSLKKNLYLIDNDKCIELINFNISFKETLKIMNNNISSNIINIIEKLEQYDWIDNSKVLTIKNNYHLLKNNFTGNIQINSIKDLNINLLINNQNKINIEEFLIRETINKYEFFYLNFINIIKMN